MPSVDALPSQVLPLIWVHIGQVQLDILHIFGDCLVQHLSSQTRNMVELWDGERVQIVEEDDPISGALVGALLLLLEHRGLLLTLLHGDLLTGIIHPHHYLLVVLASVGGLGWPSADVFCFAAQVA